METDRKDATKGMASDSTIGGPARGFPSTLWSQVLCTGDRDAQARSSAWEGLARRYWKPVFGYVRSKWARSAEDAKDLTQDFFAWMMETEFPGRADPERGRFRVFVKAALENYLRNDERNRRRQKQGGDRRIVSLDDGGGRAAAWEIPDPSGRGAEEILEEAWKDELLSRATRLLEDAYAKEGKGVFFKVFRDYYLSSSSAEPTHEEVAARHSIGASSVNDCLAHARRRFREILKALVAETVGGPEELRQELKALFGIEER